MKRALITGITGQDGSYLAEDLLADGYEVHGLVRRSSISNTKRIEHVIKHLNLHIGDILDYSFLVNLVQEIEPDEIYHLAAQSQVGESFRMPMYTGNVIAMGTLNLLEAIRISKLDISLYNASTSEMFGNAPCPQNEETPFNPVSPYGVAKLYAHYMVRNYRDAYGIFAVNGILFNHESPRRGEEFVSQKITKFIGRIKRGGRGKLFLGNLMAERDWGYAPEYVKAMQLMLRQSNPKDYVIATGESHTVKEFMIEAFSCAGLNWRHYVVHETKGLLRSNEINALRGDYSKAELELGWDAKVYFKELVKIMVEADTA